MISTTKRISLCAMCIALCYVLPVAFHSVGLGSILSPMHIPVLLCGLICGGWSGLICGIIGPAISSLLSGMPPLMMLLRMIPELCAYGFVCGFMMKIHTGKTVSDVYLSLTIGMIAGRLMGGIASAVFYTITTGVYSVALWFTSYFAESIPGIIAHLILIPILYLTMEKARVIPSRYGK
jgi:hypothetical protein